MSGHEAADGAAEYMKPLEKELGPSEEWATADPVSAWRELFDAARDMTQNTRRHDGPCEVWVASEGCSLCRQAWERRWVRLCTAVMDCEADTAK